MSQAPNLTRAQASERSATVTVSSYEITIDLTAGAVGEVDRDPANTALRGVLQDAGAPRSGGVARMGRDAREGGKPFRRPRAEEVGEVFQRPLDEYGFGDPGHDGTRSSVERPPSLPP